MDRIGVGGIEQRADPAKAGERSAQAGPSGGGADAFADAVLALTDLIPVARVLTYGDVSELLGSGGPRQVGRALARSTRTIPWWRVLRSGGHPPRGLAARARSHYDSEGTVLVIPTGTTDPSMYRVDLQRARWVPSEAEHVRIDALAMGL